MSRFHLPFDLDHHEARLAARDLLAERASVPPESVRLDSFYVESSVPPGVTLADWSRRRAAERPR